MVNERKSMLLNQMSAEEINEKVFKHYNYNGLEAYADLSLIARAEASRASLRSTTPLFLGMTGVSAFNCTRLSVLSASGKMGAVGGLVFGAAMTFTTMRM